MTSAYKGHFTVCLLWMSIYRQANPSLSVKMRPFGSCNAKTRQCQNQAVPLPPPPPNRRHMVLTLSIISYFWGGWVGLVVCTCRKYRNHRCYKYTYEERKTKEKFPQMTNRPTQQDIESKQQKKE